MSKLCTIPRCHTVTHYTEEELLTSVLQKVHSSEFVWLVHHQDSDGMNLFCPERLSAFAMTIVSFVMTVYM